MKVIERDICKVKIKPLVSVVMIFLDAGSSILDTGFIAIDCSAYPFPAKLDNRFGCC